MKRVIGECRAYTELREFATKLENGMRYWFTCVLHPEIDATNNKAENALREMVIQRKISSLWNEKGVRIKETIMSVLATRCSGTSDANMFPNKADVLPAWQPKSITSKNCIIITP